MTEEEMLLVRIKFILDMYKWGVTSTDSALERILDLLDSYEKEVAE